MSLCSRCGTQNRPGASFCRYCGANLQTGRRGQVELGGPRPWLGIEQVIYDRYRQWGLWGGLLAFLGSFSPWAQESISFLGFEVGSASAGPPQAMLIGVVTLLAIVLTFHRAAGTAVMVIGGVVVASVVMFALGASSAHPSWGLILCAVGGGMLVYSGYHTRVGSI